MLGDALRIGLPALAIPLVVLGAFAAAAGTHRLLWENLWPVDFIRVAGFRSQEDWAPLTLASGFSTARAGGWSTAACWRRSSRQC